MTLITPEPAAAWWHPRISAAGLRKKLKAHGARVTHLDPFIDGLDLRFAAVWVPESGKKPAGGWSEDITPVALRSRLKKEKARLVSIGSYPLYGMRRYAAAWVRDPAGAGAQSWHHDLGASTLKACLRDTGGLVVSLDAWTNKGKTRFAAAWVVNVGKDTDARFFPELDGAGLRSAIREHKARPVALAAYRKDGKTRYAASLVRDSGDQEGASGWDTGLTAAGLGGRLDCSYPTEIQSYPKGKGWRLAAAWRPFPEPPKSGAAKLLALGGRYRLTTVDTVAQFDNPNYQWMDFNAILLNKADFPVTVSRAHQYFADSNGAILSQPTPAFGPRGIFNGQPKTIPAKGQIQAPATATTSFGVSHFVLSWRATGNGQVQNGFRACPIVRQGYDHPPDLPLPTPVAINPLWSPVEIVPQWRKDGTEANWLRLAGQVVNKDERPKSPVRLNGIRAILEINGKRLLDEPLDPAYYPFSLGKYGDRLDVKPGGSVELQGFRTHFFQEWDLPEVPETITKGRLRLVARYNASGECRTVAVEAPVVWSRPGPLLTPPVKGHWQWGGRHPGPAQRHAQDLVRIGPNGTNIKDRPKDKPTVTEEAWRGQNSSYWCYREKVYAMAGGVVIRSDDTQVENNGDQPVAASLVNNVLVRDDRPDGPFFHGYYHLVPGENRVAVGDTVTAGQVLGLVGNSGNGSEPHLHVEAWRIDRTGRGYDVPMEFKSMTRDGKAVTAPPEGGIYDS